MLIYLYFSIVLPDQIKGQVSEFCSDSKLIWKEKLTCYSSESTAFGDFRSRSIEPVLSEYTFPK